jgi:hypothetical protein
MDIRWVQLRHRVPYTMFFFGFGLQGSESIERFIENQVSFLLYDFCSSPISSPYPASKLSLFLSLPVCRRSSYWLEVGGGGGWGVNHTTTRESLVRYKTFNTLWLSVFLPVSMYKSPNGGAWFKLVSTISNELQCFKVSFVCALLISACFNLCSVHFQTEQRMFNNTKRHRHQTKIYLLFNWALNQTYAYVGFRLSNASLIWATPFGPTE